MRSGTIAFLFGILAVHWLPTLPDSAFVQFLPVCLLAACLNKRLRPACLFLAGLLWCTLRAQLAVAEILPGDLSGVDLLAEGVVIGVPHGDGVRTRFEFVVETLDFLPRAGTRGAREGGKPPEFRGKTRLSWYGGPKLRPGERWRLEVRLKAPRGFMNPGGFDYERWLFLRGIRATGYVRRGGEARRISPGRRWNIDGWRQRIADRIDVAIPDRQVSGIVAALAVGVRDGISARQWSVLRNSGTAHLMAVSGLHVGMVAALAYLIASLAWSRFSSLCLWLPAPRVAAVAAMAAGLVYAGMAGFSLPTQRALILLGVLMWCRINNRSTAFSVALSVALGGVLVVDPFSVLGPSLWLSFGAVTVLAFGMMGRSHGDGSYRPGAIWWRWGRAQWLAAIGLAPIIIASFGQQPLLSPIANVVAIPWTGFLVVPGAIAGAFLAILWPAAGARVLGWTADLLDLLWPLLAQLADTGFVLAPLQLIPTWALLAGVIGALMVTLPKEMPARWLGVLWMLPLVGLGLPAPAKDQLWFTVLDVGHGLAAVIRTRNHTLVFDTGPRYRGGFDAGRSIVAPFLRSQGVARVDMVIVSHSDADHAGGLAGLLSQVPARRVLGEPGAAYGDACGEGPPWHWDGYEFKLLHPGGASTPPGNDSSCVLQVRGPGGVILLAADIEAAGEAALIGRYGDRLASDILVAPHHGSRTSSTPAFVQRVRPRFVLFSNGDRRRPWFPHPRVEERYRAYGARTLDTVSQGAISFVLEADGSLSAPSAYRQHAARYWHRKEKRR
jgi:competence protein ComEC